MTDVVVCKFGGTSMADGITIRRVCEIVESDPARRCIVVSAPGKRYGGDKKVTDLLFETHREVRETGRVGEAFLKVRQRFSSIVSELGVDFPIEEELDEIARTVEEEKSVDFTVSRGEYLVARIVAALLHAEFLDAREVVKFGQDDRLDAARTYALFAEALRGRKRTIVPGFYGEGADGRVKTFPRGGSDITGALAARAVRAKLYENWTDVSGFLACDPNIVPAPEGIRELTYRELRELSYMGAKVLHSESIFPVRDADIPVWIRNTFRPSDEGTRIVPFSAYHDTGKIVTGIAGKKNFTVIHVEKSLMNSEIGFTYRVLATLLKRNISFEHIPSGIDTMSFVIDSEVLRGGVLEDLCADIERAVSPDNMHIIPDIALIAVVGHGMSRSVGTSARLFRAIANAGVNVRMIDQGSSELNIIVGVDNENYERTVRAVYEEFFGANREETFPQ